MKSTLLIPVRIHRCAAVILLSFGLFASSSSAIVMRLSGPEPIIVQIKESLRLSDNLDNRLAQLAAAHTQAGLTVRKWYAGKELLLMLSFPSNFTEQQAIAVITALEQLPAVEKVVPASASRLEFKVTDFAREFASYQTMPEAARRGLDRDEQPAMTLTQIEEAAQLPHVPDQLIVRWKPRHVWRATAGGFLRDVANFHAAGGARIIREMRPSAADWTQVIELDDQVTPFVNKLRRYAECPWVDYVQPNFIYEIAAEAVDPNDPLYTDPGQLNLRKISAPNAWTITTGTQSLVVAVADTGANINHPEFAPNLSPGWRNFTVDPPDDNVADTDLTYSQFHGSHVASIIGAKGDNGQFMTGVAWNVSLLILKASPGGSADSLKFHDAINYACSNENHDPAIAINISSRTQTGKGIDEIVHKAVLNAQARNMVVVASGGNASENMDDGLNNNLQSPACIPTDNVIAVGATRVRPDLPSVDDHKSDFSNWGRYRVELGAPGGDGGSGTCAYGVIGLQAQTNSPPTWPCFDPNAVGWQRRSGTSMAAPLVTGAIALVKSRYPWEDYAGLRDRVIMGTDDVPALNNLFRTGGRLNLYKALKRRTLIKNWSTRAKVEKGDRIIVGGFTIGGSPAVPLKVAIRGLGPSLPPLEVPGVRLNDPELQLNNSKGGFVFYNDDWGNLPLEQRIDLASSGLTPSNVHEAAIVVTLFPGSYTVLMKSQDGEEGIGLFEIYELRGTTTEETRLKNVSTRCPVGAGGEVAIAGTFLQNPDDTGNLADVPKRRLLMVGRGPSLQPLGLSDTLPNPYLEVHQLQNGIDTILVSNDQWQEVDSSSTGLENKLVESHFRPPPSAPEQYLDESVLWPTLQPGAYTVFLRDSGGDSGIGLIELFEY